LLIPSTLNTHSPAFKSAQQACGKLAQPSPGQGPSTSSQQQQWLALAKCKRAHGVSDFPDPTSSPPPPSSGNVISRGGTYLAIGTQQERQSPAYKRAAATCGLTIP
jgi:hypothetical protein